MLKENTIQKLRRFCDTKCDCGKHHDFCIDDIIVEKGAINRVAEVVSRYHVEKVFLLSDCNTYEAAGEQIFENLLQAGFSVSKNMYFVKNN